MTCYDAHNSAAACCAVQFTYLCFFASHCVRAVMRSNAPAPTGKCDTTRDPHTPVAVLRVTRLNTRGTETWHEIKCTKTERVEMVWQGWCPARFHGACTLCYDAQHSAAPCCAADNLSLPSLPAMRSAAPAQLRHSTRFTDDSRGPEKARNTEFNLLATITSNFAVRSTPYGVPRPNEMA